MISFDGREEEEGAEEGARTGSLETSSSLVPSWRKSFPFSESGMENSLPLVVSANK